MALFHSDIETNPDTPALFVFSDEHISFEQLTVLSIICLDGLLADTFILRVQFHYYYLSTVIRIFITACD